MSDYEYRVEWDCGADWREPCPHERTFSKPRDAFSEYIFWTTSSVDKTRNTLTLSRREVGQWEQIEVDE